MDLLKHFLTTVEAPKSRQYWVHGTPVARGLAVRRIQRFFTRQKHFDLRVDSPDTVREFLSQGSIWPSPVLVYVGAAHRWRDDSTDSLKQWKAHSTSYLLMESGLSGWKPDEWDGEFLPRLRAFFSPTVVNTQFTRTAAGRDKLQTFVQHLTGFNAWEAKTLVDACEGETENSVVTALRLRALGGFSPRALEALMDPIPKDLIDLLLAGRKAEATRTLWEMHTFPDNYLKLLYRAVVLVSLIGRNRRAGESPFTLSSRLNVSRGVVERFLPYTRYSDPGTTRRRLFALNSAQPVWEKAKTIDERREVLMVLTAIW